MKTIDFQMPLDKVPFLFLDTETTGLSPDYGDRICEIAMLKTKNGGILDSYQSLINPGRTISPGATAVNHITNEMVNDKPYFKDIADDILEFINKSVLVIHNAPFDLSFLSAQFRLLKKPLFDNPVIDTLYLARRYYRFLGNSLGHIGHIYRLNETKLHRAYGDVAILKQIFDIFLSDFMGNGVGTLEDLLKLQGGSIQIPKPKKIILPPVLEEAMLNHQSIMILYTDSNGRHSRREVEPIDVIPKNDYIYLVGHCRLRDDQRTFRLDRIIEMKTI